MHEYREELGAGCMMPTWSLDSHSSWSHPMLSMGWHEWGSLVPILGSPCLIWNLYHRYPRTRQSQGSWWTSAHCGLGSGSNLVRGVWLECCLARMFLAPPRSAHDRLGRRSQNYGANDWIPLIFRPRSQTKIFKYSPIDCSWLDFIFSKSYHSQIIP